MSHRPNTSPRSAEQAPDDMGVQKLEQNQGEIQHEHNEMRAKINILGLRLQGPPWVQFFICVGGVFGFGVIHDFIQELVFRYDGFEFGWFMTICELLVFVVAAWAQLMLQNRQSEVTTISWSQYVGLTVVLAITQGFGSVALSYVNFPVKVVFKSSKLIPTMALGIFVLRRSYTFLEYTAGFMLCAGIATFTLVDSKVSPRFSLVGVLLLLGAVFGDAMTVNLQERLLRQLKNSKEQMMLASNLMAAAWVLIFIIFSGELLKASVLLTAQPHIAGLLFLQSLSQYMSVTFYLSLIQGYGGVVAVTVTSLRKVITIVISFVAFAKPFSWLYIPSGGLTLAGVAISVLAKEKHPQMTVVWTVAGIGVICLLLLQEVFLSFIQVDPSLSSSPSPPDAAPPVAPAK